MTAHCITPKYKTLGKFDPEAAKKNVGPLFTSEAEAISRIKRLEADLHECLEFLQKNYDVVDTFDGEQGPNAEMRLGTMISATLYGEGNF